MQLLLLLASLSVASSTSAAAIETQLENSIEYLQRRNELERRQRTYTWKPPAGKAQAGKAQAGVGAAGPKVQWTAGPVPVGATPRPQPQGNGNHPTLGAPQSSRGQEGGYNAPYQPQSNNPPGQYNGLGPGGMPLSLPQGSFIASGAAAPQPSAATMPAAAPISPSTATPAFTQVSASPRGKAIPVPTSGGWSPPVSPSRAGGDQDGGKDIFDEPFTLPPQPARYPNKEALTDSGQDSQPTYLTTVEVMAVSASVTLPVIVPAQGPPTTILNAPSFTMRGGGAYWSWGFGRAPAQVRPPVTQAEAGEDDKQKEDIKGNLLEQSAANRRSRRTGGIATSVGVRDSP